MAGWLAGWLAEAWRRLAAWQGWPPGGAAGWWRRGRAVRPRLGGGGPAMGRRVAHRQGVDQQRLANGARQLLAEKIGDPSLPGVRHHRPAEGQGHAHSCPGMTFTTGLAELATKSLVWGGTA